MPGQDASYALLPKPDPTTRGGGAGTRAMRLARLGLLWLLLAGSGLAMAQLSAPTFGTRGDVEEQLVTRFMLAFRSAVSAATGIEVRNGELITAGIAGSLDPELTRLIADLDAARYAVSGEIARLQGAIAEPYTVNLIVVDAERDRHTDLISSPLDASTIEAVALSLAAAVAEFTTARVELPFGNAGVFVSSEPGDAQVFIDGVAIGRTSALDVLMLAAGRYQLEVRKEGFLPEVRMVELRPNDTSFVHVPLTAISGGSIQISAAPRARVELDGEPVGTTPLTVAALPGTHNVTLKRDGFEDLTVEVLVRNYRVTRLRFELTPVSDPLVFWEELPNVLVFVNGIYQPGSHVAGLEPGLYDFEIRYAGGESNSYLRAVPASGSHRLDLQTGELVPLLP